MPSKLIALKQDVITEVRDYSSGEKKVVQSITKEISKAFEFDASTIEGDTKISVQESDQWVKLLKVDLRI